MKAEQTPGFKCTANPHAIAVPIKVVYVSLAPRYCRIAFHNKPIETQEAFTPFVLNDCFSCRGCRAFGLRLDFFC
jgi:hypothetical protein